MHNGPSVAQASWRARQAHLGQAGSEQAGDGRPLSHLDNEGHLLRIEHARRHCGQAQLPTTLRRPCAASWLPVSATPVASSRALGVKQQARPW